MPADSIAMLLDLLEQAYRKKTWHGPNLKASLRRLKAGESAWRPGPNRKSAWEIALHAAYWKYAVRRRLLGEKRGSFELQGSNWFPLPSDRSEKSWRAALALLERKHEALLQAVAGLSDKDLAKRAKGSSLTNLFVITGAAYHDVYHAGQIQVIKRLRESAPVRRK